jgi:hypothetical protein
MDEDLVAAVPGLSFTSAMGFLFGDSQCCSGFRTKETHVLAACPQSKLNIPLLEAFSHVMRCSAAHPTIRHAGIFIFRKIVRSHMRSVYSCLGSDNIRGAKAALLFLVSVSKHSLGAAKELVNVFNFALPVCCGAEVGESNGAAAIWETAMAGQG